MAPRIPLVAIIGRPNVGKSTLFNRIIGTRKAIVEDIAGVTRDRNYALVEEFSVPFVLVDTGGFEQDPSEELSKQVVQQTQIAVEEADVILAIFDGSTGVHPGDEDVVKMLRRSKKKAVFVVNKCDGAEQAIRTADFYSFGIGELFDISALHGRGVSSLVEEVLKGLPQYEALRSSVTARREREKDAAQEALKWSAGEEESALDRLDSLPSEDGAEIEDESDSFEIDIDENEEGLSESLSVVEEQFAPVFVPSEELSDPLEYIRLNARRPAPKGGETTYLGGMVEDYENEPELSTVPINEEEPTTLPNIPCIKLAIVGRPNVGKSTLLNTLTGEQRAITSPIAGTTRDVLDLKITRDGQDYLIIDTAGLRKKARVTDQVERFSTMRAISALAECDVALVLIDAVEGPTEQDTKIVGLAHEEGRGIVIVVNKWDLVEKSHLTVHKFTQNLREAFKFAPYAPIVFVSAISGRRCPRIIETAREVAHERMKRISTNHLNRLFQRAMIRSSPPPYRGQPIKLYYGVQVDVAPPRFALFFNYPRALHFSFLRFIKNSIREEFGFAGTDIKLMAKKRHKK